MDAVTRAAKFHAMEITIMINCLFESCFLITSLLWDLNEDRSTPYLNALENKNSQNVSEFLSKWNRGRRYDREKLKCEIYRSQQKLDRTLPESDYKIYLNEVSQILKNATKKSDEEYIGSIKLAHIYHPDIYPLVDNPILDEFGLKKENGNFSKSIDNYFCFKSAIDKIIDKYDLSQIEVRKRKIYKLIDEVLYLYITEDRKKNVELIFTITGNRLYFNLLNKLIQSLHIHIDQLKSANL